MRGIAVFPQPDAALLHLRGGALPCGAIGAATLDSDGRAALMASDPNPRPAKPPFWRVCPPLPAAAARTARLVSRGESLYLMQL